MTGEIVAPVTRSRLVRYVKTFSEHRYGRWVLAAIAFADSSFLPIPPDLLLVPMALLNLVYREQLFPRRFYQRAFEARLVGDAGRPPSAIVRF